MSAARYWHPLGNLQKSEGGERLRPMGGSTRLFYYGRERNFGDLLNLEILGRLGATGVRKSNRFLCGAVAIGSVLDVFLAGERVALIGRSILPPLAVWGSGFIRPPASGQERSWRKLDVFAVRGLKSLERLRAITGESLGGVAVGDPGLLVGELGDLGVRRGECPLGVIPHYVDKGSELLERVKVAGSRVIDVQQDPMSFLAELAACRAVLSSSLHGLVAADALGIPNARMRLTDRVVGGDYKFDDYCSAFGRDGRKAVVDLNAMDFTEGDLGGLGCMSRERVKGICAELKASFPFRGRWQGRALGDGE